VVVVGKFLGETGERVVESVNDELDDLSPDLEGNAHFLKRFAEPLAALFGMGHVVAVAEHHDRGALAGDTAQDCAIVRHDGVEPCSKTGGIQQVLRLGAGGVPLQDGLEGSLAQEVVAAGGEQKGVRPSHVQRRGVLGRRHHAAHRVAGGVEREDGFVLIFDQGIDNVGEQQRILEPAVTLGDDAQPFESGSDLDVVFDPALGAAYRVGPVDGDVAFDAGTLDFPFRRGLELDGRRERLIRAFCRTIELLKQAIERSGVELGYGLVDARLNFILKITHRLPSQNQY
jgi:hypothetical protein